MFRPPPQRQATHSESVRFSSGEVCAERVDRAQRGRAWLGAELVPTQAADGHDVPPIFGPPIMRVRGWFQRLSSGRQESTPFSRARLPLGHELSGWDPPDGAVGPDQAELTLHASAGARGGPLDQAAQGRPYVPPYLGVAIRRCKRVTVTTWRTIGSLLWLRAQPVAPILAG